MLTRSRRPWLIAAVAVVGCLAVGGWLLGADARVLRTIARLYKDSHFLRPKFPGTVV